MKKGLRPFDGRKVNGEKMKSAYHLGLSRKMIKEAKLAFLPDDPERGPKIAKTFDENAIKIAYFNERI